jgi:predicted P-loop ATPase
VWLAKHGYESRIALDTFRQVITIDGQPLSDELVIEMVRQMEASAMMHWAEAHVRSAIINVGSRHTSSSVKQWLESLAWDGKHRLWRFFTDTYGAELTDYTDACARVLFLSAVARAYQPGCKADVMVVLIGDQGIGKSQGIEKLVPEQTWYTDDLGGDLSDRRAGEGVQGKWLIEFSEFARINRATLEMVKSYLSRRVDHFRPAYGHMAKDFPRQCIFIGTTNNPLPLQDIENRRFMPVRCPSLLVDITPDVRDQLWAEAVARYTQGETWWVDNPALLETVKQHQDDARQHDEWEQILRAWLDVSHAREITINSAAAHLNIKEDRLDKSTQTRLGIVLKALGYQRWDRGKDLLPRYVYRKHGAAAP